mmetsp:Transcript_32323/g.83883  ORF Transcript_32323/g.83883 Transcript_32323/m.83883 type:complete len:84 (+) Transcript_32323:1072-1323(+)
MRQVTGAAPGLTIIHALTAAVDYPHHHPLKLSHPSPPAAMANYREKHRPADANILLSSLERQTRQSGVSVMVVPSSRTVAWGR